MHKATDKECCAVDFIAQHSFLGKGGKEAEGGMRGSCRTMGLKTQHAALAHGARCMSHRSALRRSSHRTASPRQAATAGNRRATAPSAHHSGQTPVPHSTPKQGAPAEALHQLIQKQEPRCLIRSTAVSYFKKAVPSSATARLPHRHPAFGTSMKLSSTHILPHSPSGRSTVHDPKCRFDHQITKSSAGRASPLSHSTRNQGLSRSGLLYSRGLPFSAFVTALPAARATASPAAVSHSIVGAKRG